jgi:hypothetical protein
MLHVVVMIGAAVTGGNMDKLYLRVPVSKNGLKDVTKSILKRTITFFRGCDYDIVHTRFVVIENAQYSGVATCISVQQFSCDSSDEMLIVSWKSSSTLQKDSVRIRGTYGNPFRVKAGSWHGFKLSR